MRTRLDYSGPGWQPWLCESSIQLLERTQNKALRIISGQLRSSPVEALRYETSIVSYTTHMDRNILKSHEKAKRLPTSHPSHVALSSSIAPRNLRSSWASRGKELSSSLPPEAEARKPISLIRDPPPGNRAINHSSSPPLRGSTTNLTTPSRFALQQRMQ